MLENYTFNKLEDNSCPKPFNCSNPDLNEFFSEDARSYSQQLLAVTYYYESNNKTVAYFSVVNDKIVNKDEEKKTISKILAKKIPYKKRRISYPASKVVRLGVHVDCQSQGLGGEILTFIKGFFAYNNKTGCRFITVDAYNESRVIRFYENNGFKLLTEQDANDDTRLMYFDLITFQESP